MKYRLKEPSRFVCGNTSFSLDAYAVVEIKQTDKEYSKVLIDFGDRCVDWFHVSILDKFEEVKDF